MRKQSKMRKQMSMLTIGALLLTSVSMPSLKTESKAAGYGINNPRIEKNIVVSGEETDKVEGKLRNPLVKADVTTWDCITFGRYPQEDTNGDGKVDETDDKQPIKWRVLSVDGEDAFLLADDILESKVYNEQKMSVTWETSTLRTWLNEDFYNMAFSEDECAAIIETKIENPDSPSNKNSIEGGNDTVDKVFLLSRQEACDEKLGFSNSFESSESTNTRKASESWWLRSPAFSSSSATIVDMDGSGDGGALGFLKEEVTYKNGVRPAVHINLSKSCWKKTNQAKVQDISTTWDCVYFGKYYQDENSMEKEAIKWRVLSVNGDDVFMVADQGLDCQSYNETDEEVTWESSSLRDWLNTDFQNEAFSNAEKNAIVSTVVVNDDGNDTTDKIYLLSQNEVTNITYGFEPEFRNQNDTRKLKNTEYASKVKGALKLDPQYGGDPWWLRTVGKDKKKAATVSWTYGTGNTVGEEVNKSHAVRPALHIKLSSDMWEDAGTTSSYGDITEPVFVKNQPKEYGITNPSRNNSVSSWDCIYFGKYWQDDTNGDGNADKMDQKQPIKWRVLSIKGSEALILADEILDCHNYYNNTEPVDMIWKDSEISNWLNDTFFITAFSENEQFAINRTRLGSEITKVFLLSDSEVLDKQYQISSSSIAKEKSKQAKRTAYAIACGAGALEDTTDKNGNWMLRSMSLTNVNNEWKYDKVQIVSSEGYISSINAIEMNEKCGIRPVLRVNLDSKEWTYAGKVLDDGTFIKPEDIVKPTPIPVATPSSSPLPSKSPSASSTPVPIVQPTVQPTKSPVPTASLQATQNPSTSPTTTPASTVTMAPQLSMTSLLNMANQEIQSQQPSQTDVNNAVKNSTPNLSKVSWKSVKNFKTSKVVLKWKKVSRVNEYEIQYALNKKFKQVKTKLVRSTSITFRKLKKEKNYFFRVRACKIVAGKKVYGKWSVVRKVNIKK